jgi:hypothetical protein
MKMPRFINRIVVLAFSMLLACSGTGFAQTPPECDCYTLYPDVFSEDYLDCEANGCTGVSVPVSGNVWVLALAGFVFAFVKFGGHTRLAGYYYSKMERQE